MKDFSKKKVLDYTTFMKKQASKIVKIHSVSLLITKKMTKILYFWQD